MYCLKVFPSVARYIYYSVYFPLHRKNASNCVRSFNSILDVVTSALLVVYSAAAVYLLRILSLARLSLLLTYTATILAL